MMLCRASLVCGWSRRSTVERCLNDVVWGRSAVWQNMFKVIIQCIDSLYIVTKFIHFDFYNIDFK